MTTTDKDKGKLPCIIRRKTPMAWMAIVKKVEGEHWRRLRVTIELRDQMHAGKPRMLKAAEAMIAKFDKDMAKKGIESPVEAVLPTPDEVTMQREEVVDEGVCEFHRREGRSGMWFPTNNIKAGIKENWCVLGLRVSERGSRGAIAEGLFVWSVQDPDQPAVERDWLYLGDEPDGIHEGITHSMTPRGKIAALKRNEYVSRRKLTFEIAISHAVEAKLPDEEMARMLVHFSEHGLGANRSQGFGKFDVCAVVEIGDDGQPIEFAA